MSVNILIMIINIMDVDFVQGGLPASLWPRRALALLGLTLYYPYMDKLYFSYQEIHKTAQAIADKVRASGFDPDLIVAIGSGGFIPARILRTFLGKPIYTVGVAYYDLNDKPTELPRKIQWIEEAERHLAGKKILLVDEVDDSRATLEYCIRELLANHPAEVAVAVLHDKAKEKRGQIPSEVRHYFSGQTLPDMWIVYPWDAHDIDAHDALVAAGKAQGRMGVYESELQFLSKNSGRV